MIKRYFVLVSRTNRRRRIRFSQNMANAPDRFEAVVLPDGVAKLEYQKDTKVPHSAIVKIEREDHTIGNLLRMQLLRDPKVIFAAYRAPHPLQHHIIIRVQTKSSDREPYTPIDALANALSDLNTEMSLLSERLEEEIQKQQFRMVYS
ncbi:DNA-directed RNA polymerases II, IV and V subunit 11 [Galdieria sulphuraria]|nr:DNA-directed RNA polymerases II, IV and V subunit 11 [Galdieria sulphuraria]